METEISIYSKVKKYLMKLGYPIESIIPEYSTWDKRRIDMVVKISNEILLAVELKNLPLKELVPSNQLGYHPIIRQLQADATALNAKYYLLTNGKEYIWLKTGEDGRPGKIHEVSYNHYRTTTQLTTGEFLDVILDNTSHYIKQSKITGDFLYDFSILLYYRLLQEINPEKESELDIRDILGNHYVEKEVSTRNLLDTIQRGIDIFSLTDTRLLDNLESLLEYIDNLFLKNGHEWNVPRWLGNMIINILGLSKKAELLDIFGRNGTVLSCAHFNGYNNIRSFCIIQKDFYWIKIQKLLSSQKEKGIIYNPDIESLYENLSQYSPSGIILAPPFNVKISRRTDSELTYNGVLDVTSVFMEKSLHILKEEGKVIAIVPNGFLSSSSDKKTRKYIKEYIECIVHLPAGTFKPYSQVKTSILVLNKEKKHLKNKEVLFIDLKNIPLEKSWYNSPKIDMTGIAEILKQFRSGYSIKEDENIYQVKSLKTDNFQLSAYKTQAESNPIEYLHKSFKLIPLKELAIIERGNSLVKDEEGNIPYMNPGMIRQLELREEEICYTSEKKLPQGKIRRLKTGQTVINSIGPYIGKAALTTDKFDGILFNRHIIAITPKDIKILHSGYLSIILNSEIVQEQFYNRISGSVIDSLNLSSFNNILIPVISFEQQLAIYDEYSNWLEQLERIEKEKADIKRKIRTDLLNLGKGKEGII